MSMNNKQGQQNTYYVSVSFSQPPSATNRLRPQQLYDGAQESQFLLPTSPLSLRGSEIIRKPDQPEETPLIPRRNVSFGVGRNSDLLSNNGTANSSQLLMSPKAPPTMAHLKDQVYVVSLSILPPLDAIARIDEKLPPFSQISWTKLKSFVGRKEIPRRIANESKNTLTSLKIKAPLVRGLLPSQQLEAELQKLRQERHESTGDTEADHNLYLMAPNSMSSAGLSEGTFNWHTKSFSGQNLLVPSAQNSLQSTSNNLLRPAANNISLSGGGEPSPRGTNWISSGGGLTEDYVTGVVSPRAEGVAVSNGSVSGGVSEGATSNGGWLSARWGSVFGGQAATSVVQKERMRRLKLLQALSQFQRENTVMDVTSLPQLTHLDASLSYFSHLRVFLDPAPSPLDPQGPFSPCSLGSMATSNNNTVFDASATLAHMRPSTTTSAQASPASPVSVADRQQVASTSSITQSEASRRIHRSPAEFSVANLKETYSNSRSNSSLVSLDVSQNWFLETLPDRLINLKYLNISSTRLPLSELNKLRGYTSLEVLVAHLSSSEVTKESKTLHKKQLAKQKRMRRKSLESVSLREPTAGLTKAKKKKKRDDRKNSSTFNDNESLASTAHFGTDTNLSNLNTKLVTGVASRPISPMSFSGAPPASIISPAEERRIHQKTVSEVTDESTAIQRDDKSTPIPINPSAGAPSEVDDTATDAKSLNATLDDVELPSIENQAKHKSNPLPQSKEKVGYGSPLLTPKPSKKTNEKFCSTDSICPSETELNVTLRRANGEKVETYEQLTIPEYPHHTLPRLPSSLKHLVASDDQTTTDISSLFTDCPNLISLDLSGAARLYSLPEFASFNPETNSQTAVDNKSNLDDDVLVATKIYGSSMGSPFMRRRINNSSCDGSLDEGKRNTILGRTTSESQLGNSTKFSSPMEVFKGAKFALPLLSSLSITNSQLRSLKPLAYHPSLTFLDISYSQHITSVPELPQLRTLLASHCDLLQNVSQLHGNAIVEVLDISDCILIVELPIMPNIRRLNISHTGIQDLAPLLQMKGRLQFLSLASLWPTGLKRSKKNTILENNNNEPFTAAEGQNTSKGGGVMGQLQSALEPASFDSNDTSSSLFAPVIEEFPYLEVMHVAGSAFVDKVRADPRSTSLLTDVYELGSWCSVM